MDGQDRQDGGGGEGAHKGHPYGVGGGAMVALTPALSHGERGLDSRASGNDGGGAGMTISATV